MGIPALPRDNLTHKITHAGISLSRQKVYHRIVETQLSVGNTNAKHLPIVDPLVEGRLWNSAGVLTVSAG